MKYRIWEAGCFGRGTDKQRRMFDSREAAEDAARSANVETWKHGGTMDAWEVDEDRGACPDGEPHVGLGPCRRCVKLGAGQPGGGA